MEEKYKNFRGLYMNNPRVIQLYVNIIEQLKKFDNSDLFIDESKNTVEEEFDFLLKNIIYILPNDIRLKDVEDINKMQVLLKIIEDNFEILKICNLSDEKKKNAFDKIKNEEVNNKAISYLDEKIFLSNISELKEYVFQAKNELKSNTDTYFYTGNFMGMAVSDPNDVDYFLIRLLLFSYKDMFQWTLIFIYNAIFYSYKEKFENSELNTLLLNLEQSTDDIIYINNKLFDLYLQLYTDLFDIKLTKYQIYRLISLVDWSKVPEILELKSNVLSVISKQISSNSEETYLMKNKDDFEPYCKKIIDDKYVSNQLYTYIKKENVEFEYFIFDILFLMFNMLSSWENIEFLNYEDLIYYRNTFYNFLKNEEINKTKIEAEKERDRILRGDYSKEIELQKQEVEYSNVQNGYDFEEYVANLYSKLGYSIEEVTQKSGDQRSRCYCI